MLWRFVARSGKIQVHLCCDQEDKKFLHKAVKKFGKAWSSKALPNAFEIRRNDVYVALEALEQDLRAFK